MLDDTLDSWLQGALGSEPKRTDQPEGPDSSPPRWWDEQDADDRQGRRRKAVWVLAALPWLIVAGLALGRGRTPVPAVAPVIAAAPLPSPAPQEVSPDRTPPEQPLDPALGAVAALAVQGALTSTDPATGRARYVDLALPEAATWIGDIAIVRVAAVVLEGAQGRWDQPRRARYAVPIGTGQGALTLLSPPWALPDPPQTTPAVAALTPLEDQARAELAGRAMTAAGYQDVDVHGLARHPVMAGVLQAEANAIAPGETSSRRHTVWLRDDPVPTLLGMGENGRAGTVGGRESA
ncbi:MAG: hypothetical protein ACRD0K_02820 [Egibacteraceae bacterium]